MLLSKQIQTNDIITFKLITNEEIVAKVVLTGFDFITITKPMQISIGVDEHTKQYGIQMSPYFLLCADHDTNITINKSHIIVITPANDFTKAGYIQNTTGLTMAINSSNTNGIIK